MKNKYIMSFKTKTNNDIVLYIDGVSVGFGVFTGDITFTNPVNTYLGKWWNGEGACSNGYLYEGLIERISLWSTALDSEQSIGEVINLGSNFEISIFHFKNTTAIFQIFRIVRYKNYCFVFPAKKNFFNNIFFSLYI